ncbi:MAG: hypothetical protein J6K21_02835 [Bacilli bacterium]|nr:hypothetical protein [Bacilli bacterium]
MELKELKCKNCGSTLEVEKNTEIVTCNFCNTTFSVETNENKAYQEEKGRLRAQDEKRKEMIDELDKKTKPMRLIGKIWFIVILIIFVLIFLTILYNIVISHNKSNNMKVNSFNSVYELYSGKQTSLSVNQVLKEVITNNNKNNNHLITVIYEDNNTTDTKVITDINNSIETYENYNFIYYNISYEYDKNGYIYQVKIEK